MLPHRVVHEGASQDVVNDDQGCVWSEVPMFGRHFHHLSIQDGLLLSSVSVWHCGFFSSLMLESLDPDDPDAEVIEGILRYRIGD